MPVYVRAGSIVPWGPAVQYANEKNWDNLEVRVYPGADATFTLYEDENDGYNYENGIYSTIDFKWDDAARTLTVDDRNGTFPGMLKKRNFRIVLVDKDSCTGDAPSQGGKTIRYSGKRKTIKL